MVSGHVVGKVVDGPNYLAKPIGKARSFLTRGRLDNDFGALLKLSRLIQHDDSV